MNRLLLAFCSLFLCCIQHIELPVREGQKRLIVEGFITNAPGPYTIRLTRSARYESALNLTGVIENERDAIITIRDRSGGITELKELGNGYYQTPISFQGEVGQTYSLNVFTSDGGFFASRPVTIPEGTSIKEVQIRYEQKPSTNKLKFISGVNLFVTIDDDAAGSNFYMTYCTDGVYPFISSPKLAEQNSENPCLPIANIPRCFRYERDYFEPSLSVVTSQSCRVFKAADFDFTLFDDRFRNGTELTNIAAFIEDDGRRFEFSYRTNVNLLTISREAYGFYLRLAGQFEIDGDIFDPPPAQILGNIIPLDGSDQEVLGYFGAFFVDSREVYIEGEILDLKQRKVIFGNDCINLDSSTVNKPIDWSGSSW